jgi:RecB family exonuclease
MQYIKDNKTPPDKAQFIKWFKDDLENRPMESHDQRKNFMKRGENKLSEYYCQIINTTPTSLIDQEKKLEYVMEDGTKFYGIIDRIDINEDGTYTIYDYKTGNNKNSGIKIGGDHEDYYNQMAWYKYFYEKATGKKVSLTKFIYPEDFLSKNEGIKYSDEEIDAAVETFKQAVKGIKAHEFEPNSSDKNCKYCASRDFCGLNRF